MIWGFVQSDLEEAAEQAAAIHTLPIELVCAVCEQESGDRKPDGLGKESWQPWAIRAEPLFETKYVQPLHLVPTEEWARSMSWGLMQIMGETARELGYKGPIPQLMEPDIGIEWGCVKLVKCLKEHGDLEKSLLAYNGGGDPEYGKKVMARMAKYKP